MTDRELDHILGEQPEIQPSAAFTEAVMRAVRQDAATPPPIQFPLLIAAPMALAWGLTLVAVILVPFYNPGVPAPPAGGFSFDWSGVQYVLGTAASWMLRAEVAWVAIALLLTLACIQVPLRLMRGRP